MVVRKVRGRNEEVWRRPGGTPGTAKGPLADRTEGSPDCERKFRECSGRGVSTDTPSGGSAGTFPERCRNVRRIRIASRGLFEEECLKSRNGYGSENVPAEPCGSLPEAWGNRMVREYDTLRPDLPEADYVSGEVSFTCVPRVRCR